MGVILPDALVNVYSNKTCVQLGLLGDVRGRLEYRGG